MKCPKCGNEFEGNFCPKCGEQSNQFILSQPVADDTKKAKKSYATISLVLGIVGMLFSCIWIGIIPSIIACIAAVTVLKNGESGKNKAILGLITGLIGIIIFISVLATLGSDEENTTAEVVTEEIDQSETDAIAKGTDISILEQLSKFTIAGKDDNRYLFLCDSTNSDSLQAWEFVVTDVNRFFKLWDPEICEDIETMLGEDTISDAGLGYSLPDERISIYFDADAADGLEIISYYFDEERYKINMDGKAYEISDELEEAFVQDKIIERFEADIEIITKNLNDQHVDIKDLKELDYASCDKMLTNVELMPYEELQEREPEETSEKIVEEPSETAQNNENSNSTDSVPEQSQNDLCSVGLDNMVNVTINTIDGYMSDDMAYTLLNVTIDNVGTEDLNLVHLYFTIKTEDGQLVDENIYTCLGRNGLIPGATVNADVRFDTKYTDNMALRIKYLEGEEKEIDLDNMRS